MFLDIEVFFPRHLEPSAGGNKSVGSVSGGLICHLFLSSMTLNWISICWEVSVLFLFLLLIFVILSRVRCSLTMMFDRSFSLTMLLDLSCFEFDPCCSKPSLMILYMGRSTFPWRRSRWQGARNRLSWFEEAVVLFLFLSAMTLNWTSEKTENSYLMWNESVLVMEFTRLAYRVRLLIVIRKALGVSPLNALVRCWMRLTIRHRLDQVDPAEDILVLVWLIVSFCPTFTIPRCS